MASFSFAFAVLAWFAFLHCSVSATGNNTTSIAFQIMPLGASVTFGVGSTTGDSYRKDLEDLLVANGNTVKYVGTYSTGNFTDNAVEATPGFVISQIAGLANTAVSLDFSRKRLVSWLCEILSIQINSPHCIFA
jgi:hypothetical protein